MIDHMGGFADEATAKAYPEWVQYCSKPTGSGGWDPWCCITPILIWDPAFDRPGPPDPITGNPSGIVHQPYDFIWRVTVRLSQMSQALYDSSPTQLIYDHTTGEVILTRYFTEATFQRLWMQPIFVGSKYPFQSGQGGMIP